MKTILKIIVLSGILIIGACSKSDNPNQTAPVENNDPPKESEGNNDPPEEVGYEMETLLTGLIAPQGIEIDGQGRLWVAEQGTGQNDSQISIVDENGQAHAFLVDIPSALEEGSAGGVHHLLIEGDTIWAVVGITSKVQEGYLLKLDASGFTPGDTPLVYGQSHIVADVADLTLNHNFTNQTDESNVFNLDLGPDGNIYMVDAAANAVIEFDRATNDLSVLAELPTIANSSGVGPPMMDAVPTGILFQNGGFLVSTFVGFPFNEGDSRIYEVSLTGGASSFAGNFTGLVDMVDDGNKIYLVEYGSFGSQGFQASTGKIIMLENNVSTTIAENLNFPNGICIGSDGALYVTLIGGSVVKLSEK